jgi:hypothetical protein
MPYIGNVPAEAYSEVRYQDLTTQSGTSFTLDYPVGSEGEIEVFVNNVRQEPTVAYTVNGTALTMTGSIAATDDFYIVFQGKAEKSGTIPEKQTDGTYVFPDDVTVSGNITSTGIDDNATSTAMTLDSSGNLLVGGTSSGAAQAVTISGTGGYVQARAASSATGFFDRLTTDGDIAVFRKDGSTVGSIGTASGKLQINGSSGTGFFLDTTQILPKVNGSLADNQVDLGSTGYRFNELWLGGGVYLGGTGSANKLEDYEEGTWTPVLTGNGGNAVSNGQFGYYTKIGNLVTLTGTYSWSSSGSNANIFTRITGLPFAGSSDNSSRGGGSVGATNGIADSDGLVLIVDPNANHAWLINREGTNFSHNNTVSASGAIYGFVMTYRTDA